MKCKDNPVSEDLALMRLIKMGLMLDGGEVDINSMEIFARMYFGLFIWETECAEISREYCENVCSRFCDLSRKEEYGQMYLLLAVQYDRMRKPLPEAVWWLFNSEKAVSSFMCCFTECFRQHLQK